jgi:hypothetical protein
MMHSFCHSTYLGLDSLIGTVVEADPAIAGRLAVSGQVVDLRGPHEFAAGIKEIRDQLAAIAQTLGIKAAQ